MNAPCKRCQKRGCGIYHDQCEKYQAFREERENVLEEHRKDTEKDGFKIESILKCKRLSSKK